MNKQLFMSDSQNLITEFELRKKKKYGWRADWLQMTEKCLNFFRESIALRLSQRKMWVKRVGVDWALLLLFATEFWTYSKCSIWRYRLVNLHTVYSFVEIFVHVKQTRYNHYAWEVKWIVLSCLHFPLIKNGYNEKVTKTRANWSVA